MKNIYVGLIMCIISNNQVFCNISWIEQKFTYALMISEQDATLENSLNDIDGNTIHDLAEPFIDINENNVRDAAEPFIDRNNNGSYDVEENFQDLNQNGICDIQEPFMDEGNGVYDIGEKFNDINGNNIYDLELWYVDNNRNGKWDAGDPFEDLDNDGEKGYKEPFTDNNNNNMYDAPEKTGDNKFTFSAVAFAESFIDIPNGRYDMGEKYEDLNNDDKWTPAEEYEDLNGDDKWTPAEEYEDLNGDGKWTAGKDPQDYKKNIIRDQRNVESMIDNTLMTSDQDTTLDNQNNFLPDLSPNIRSFKSPGKALLYSGVMPGMGEVYMGNWRRGLLFLAIDGIAISTWYQNDKLAEEKKDKYKYYANAHWNFGTWVQNYYNWFFYDENNPNPEWNAIREVFTNHSDSLSDGGRYAGCAEEPEQGKCYIDIWEHGHEVEFWWDGDLKSSNSDEDFKDVYIDLCAQNPDQTYVPTDRVCDNDSLTIANIMSEHSAYVIKDHHFYEGIGKYDMFFAGWDDHNSVTVQTKEHGDKNAMSPNKVAYRNLWDNYNIIKTLAVNGGKFMLINRVVSMLDALLLAKKWNNKHNMKLSLNAYPNLRNKSGVGGIKLSLDWK